MLHDYGIFLSNVCPLGLSKVIIYAGVVLGLFWVLCQYLHSDAFVLYKIKQ